MSLKAGMYFSLHLPGFYRSLNILMFVNSLLPSIWKVLSMATPVHQGLKQALQKCDGQPWLQIISREPSLYCEAMKF